MNSCMGESGLLILIGVGGLLGAGPAWRGASGDWPALPPSQTVSQTPGQTLSQTLSQTPRGQFAN